MKITRDEAKRIADLAHLAFDDAALDRMGAEMTRILAYIDQLTEVEAEADVGRPSSRPPARRSLSSHLERIRPARRT